MLKLHHKNGNRSKSQVNTEQVVSTKIGEEENAVVKNVFNDMTRY